MSNTQKTDDGGHSFSFFKDLDLATAIIRTRLATYSKLTSQRLFAAVCAAGYAGGYGRVRAYVKTLRQPVEVPVVRFETSAGHQGPVNFGTFRTPWGARHALVVALGYSRRLWLQFYASQVCAPNISILKTRDLPCLRSTVLPFLLAGAAMLGVGNAWADSLTSDLEQLKVTTELSDRKSTDWSPGLSDAPSLSGYRLESTNGNFVSNASARLHGVIATMAHLSAQSPSSMRSASQISSIDALDASGNGEPLAISQSVGRTDVSSSLDEGTATLNDHREHAKQIEGPQGVFEGHTRRTTFNKDEVDSYLGYSALWWRFKQDKPGWVHLEVNGEQPMILTVRQVGIDDRVVASSVWSHRTSDSRSAITFHAAAKQEFFVTLGHESPSLSTAFELHWREREPPLSLDYVNRLGNGELDPAGRLVDFNGMGQLAINDEGDELYLASARGLQRLSRDLETGELYVRDPLNPETEFLTTLLVWDATHERLLANQCGSWQSFNKSVDANELTSSKEINVVNSPHSCGFDLIAASSGRDIYRLGDRSIDLFRVSDVDEIHYVQSWQVDELIVAELSHDATHIYVISDTALKVFRRNLDDGELVSTDFEHHFLSPSTLSVSPNGEFLTAIDTEGQLLSVFDLQDPGIPALIDGRSTQIPHKQDVIADGCGFSVVRPNNLGVDVFCEGSAFFASVETSQIESEEAEITNDWFVGRHHVDLAEIGTPVDMVVSPDGRFVYLNVNHEELLIFDRNDSLRTESTSDLTIDSLVAETDRVRRGEPLKLTTKIENLGDGQAEHVVARLRFSTDRFVTQESIEAHSISLSKIEPSHDQTIEFDVDTTMGVGTYYFVACADKDPAETNISNNCSPTYVLDIAQDSHEVIYEVNDTIETMPTGFWTPDRRSNGVFVIAVGSSVILEFDNGGIVEEGDYRYTCDHEDGCRVANRVVTDGRIVETLLSEGESEAPDLIVESPMASEDNVAPSASVMLSVRVRNRGDADAAATTVRFYRSDDSDITSSDTEHQSDSVAALAAGASSVHSATVVVPSEPGTYYYGACVDSVTDESSTSNNCSAAVSLRVYRPVPDLVVESPSVSEAERSPGEVFTLTATVRNQGTGESSASVIEYYQSANSTISSSDTRLGESDVAALAADASSEHSTEVTAPAQANVYYYGACVVPVDDEVVRSNNCSVGVAVEVDDESVPDLAVQLNSSAMLNATTGESVSFDVRVSNESSASSAATTLKAYTSQNLTISSQDTESASVAVASLAASAQRDLTIEITAPGPGVYYVGACIEPLADEIERTNNCSSSVVLAVSPVENASTGPDLTISEVSVSNAAPDIGTTIDLSVVVLNQGDADVSSTDLTYYQSADAEISLDDQAISVEQIDRLSADSSIDASIRITVPPVEEAIYYGACVERVVVDINTSNNCSTSVMVDPIANFAAADHESFNDIMEGKRLHGERFFVDFMSDGRYRETLESYGDFSYTKSDSRTGVVVLTYDEGEFGGSCTVTLNYRNSIRGSLSYTCESGLESETEPMAITGQAIAAAPVVAAAESSNDAMEVGFTAIFAAGETRAYDFRVRRKSSREDWRGFCREYRNNLNEKLVGTPGVVVSGISAGVTYEVGYRYRNSASCVSGAVDDWSLSGNYTHPGELPSDGVVFADTDGLTRYLIENSPAGINVGNPITTLGGTNLTYSLNGADATNFDIVPETGQIRTQSDVAYDFEVQSQHSVEVNASNDESDASVDVVIQILNLSSSCGSLTGILAAPADQQVVFTWDKPNTTLSEAAVLGYETSMREVGGSWTTPRRYLGYNITSSSYVGLVNAREYEFRVRPFNQEGECAWSEPIAATPTTDLAPNDPGVFFERTGRTPIGTDGTNLQFFSPRRCRYSNDGTSRDANCDYEVTSSNAGTITLEFDDRSSSGCDVRLAYSSLTAGSFIDECGDAGVNTDFDTSFRIPVDPEDSDSSTVVARAPRNQAEFAALTWNRDDLIPGLRIGGCSSIASSCNVGASPASATYAFMHEYDHEGGVSYERWGTFSYENTGLNQGILTFNQNKGRSWRFTLDFDSSGNMRVTIEDPDFYSSSWPPVPYLDLNSAENFIVLPVPPSWNPELIAGEDFAPDNLESLEMLVAPVDDRFDAIQRMLLGRVWDENEVDEILGALPQFFEYKKVGKNRATVTLQFGTLNPDDGDASEIQELVEGTSWFFDLTFTGDGFAELTLTLSQDGIERIVETSTIDFKNSENESEFPDEVFPPVAAPQALGEDAPGIEIASVRTIDGINNDDIQTFVVNNPESREVAFNPGDWLEPKDGENQRMMIVGTSQAAASRSPLAPSGSGTSVVATAHENSLQRIDVVCMQFNAPAIPKRGSRYFSKPKVPESAVELCQRDCVIDEADALQGCVWECERNVAETEQARANFATSNKGRSDVVDALSFAPTPKNMILPKRRNSSRLSPGVAGAKDISGRVAPIPFDEMPLIPRGN